MALRAAGFEVAPRSQQRLLDACRDLAARIGTTILPGLPWNEVPTWLAESAGDYRPAHIAGLLVKVVS
ncbi:MAG: hypothetical protein JO281_06440 [Pseudonocardiales bacterium]|nr:hypothetical protein [Pseudonocardiales bacterium]